MRKTFWIAAGGALALAGAAVAYAQYRNTEEPDYASVAIDGAFELRDYPALVVAEITHTGTRQAASSRSFRRLAAYIFGQDRPAGGEKIAMTSPVLQDRAREDEKIAMTAPVLEDEVAKDAWRMRFVMPAKYTLDTLPEPPADITLSEIPARRVAAVRFAGNGSAEDLAEMEQMLAEWVEAQGLRAKGAFEYAFYDAPMVPGPLRRNEVLVEVEEAAR
ncbi:heme-binding protein [Erythrobacter sp.]|uniref:SOUL family heme-binding protein n=1 Tax=Erythrobacter sp. TaxID=1042 RepID=UPI001425FA95|nr:heme-binding protein [Erythrobacter sp.]QIQ85606.1 MAG: heme-binding protein [Erythrobacter sp.]